MPKLPALLDTCSRIPSSSSSLHTTATACKKFKRQKLFKPPVDYARRQLEDQQKAKHDNMGPQEARVRLSGERDLAFHRVKPDLRAGNGFGIGESWLGRETEEEPPVETKRQGWLTGKVSLPDDVESGDARSEASTRNAPSPTPSSSSSRSGLDYGEFKPVYTDPSLVKFGNASKTDTLNEPWMPTKKLTQSAMAGLKALHESDPVKYSRDELSERFGISYESVKRITRSKFRDSQNAGLEASGSKWDTSAERGEGLSPVPALRRAGIEPQPRPAPARTGFGFGGSPSRAPSESSRSGGFGLGGSSSGKASSFGLRSRSSAPPSANPVPTDQAYRPRMAAPTSLADAERIVPPAPTAFQASLSPFNGPRGLRSAIKHMLRSDAKREIEMEELTESLSPEERRLAEEVEAERHEANLANRAAIRRKKAKNLKLNGEGIFD